VANDPAYAAFAAALHLGSAVMQSPPLAGANVRPTADDVPPAVIGITKISALNDV
jgi:hypothetical protein